MTFAVIVQARMGSTRLPGKVLEPIGCKSALAWCLERCAKIPGVDAVVAAIPYESQSDPVAEEAVRCGALVVGEPTSNYPLVGHKGSLWLELQTTGVTAHGSMPEQGVNAIYKAVDAVGKLREFDFNIAPHPNLPAQ